MLIGNELGTHRDTHTGPCGIAWKACRQRNWSMPKGPAREAAMVACNQEAKQCAQAHPGLGEAGELGWGWRSAFSKVGRATYGVGRGAYRVASMPVKAALRVANATSGVLCKQGASTGSAQDAQTASAFCRAMKAKDQVTVRRLLPQATAVAAKAAQAQKTYAAARSAYSAPINGAGLGDLSSFRACVKSYVDELGYSVSDARAVCQSEMSGSDDVNLLAPLYGVNPDELAYALSGVDPSEIGAVMTKTDAVALAPAAIAVVAGFWMLLRG